MFNQNELKTAYLAYVHTFQLSFGNVALGGARRTLIGPLLFKQKNPLNIEPLLLF